MTANDKWAIVWYRLRDVDKKYERCIASMPHDPLNAKAAMALGKIVGTTWETGKGFFAQVMFREAESENVIHPGPFNTEKDAMDWIDVEWTFDIQRQAVSA